MYCVNCGSGVTENAVYCAKCGQPVAAQTAPPQPTPEALEPPPLPTPEALDPLPQPTPEALNPPPPLHNQIPASPVRQPAAVYPVKRRGLAGKIIGLFISIGLIIGGISGTMVLRGTNSSTALIVVGFLFLIGDIVSLAMHGKQGKAEMNESQTADLEQMEKIFREQPGIERNTFHAYDNAALPQGGYTQKFCMNCGSIVTGVYAYCPYCGRTIGSVAPPWANPVLIREPPAPRKVFLLPLIFFGAAVLLFVLGIVGLASNSSASGASKSFDLSTSSYVNKGTYEIRAIYNFRPGSSYAPMFVFTFQNTSSGAEYVSNAVKDSQKGSYHLLSKIDIKESGVYRITVTGSASGVLFQNAAVDSGFLTLVNYKEVAGFRSANPFLPQSLSVVMTVFGSMLLITTLLLFDYARRKRYNASARPKSRTAALVLAIIPYTGWFGIHRMYLGYVGTGIVQFVTCGGCLVWWIIDLVKIANGSMKDVNGNLLRRKWNPYRF